MTALSMTAVLVALISCNPSNLLPARAAPGGPLFYADPSCRATGQDSEKTRHGYFPIFPSSCASSGSAW